MSLDEPISVTHAPPQRSVWRLAACAMLVAVLALAAADRSLATGPLAVARAARTVDGTATGRLHLLRAEGSELIEEGSFSGALNGSASADVETGAIFRGTFTIRTRKGSISGHGTATPHGAGRYQSFGGSFMATGGSGLYKHVHGRSKLYGVFDRRTDSLVLQTSGSFTY